MSDYHVGILEFIAIIVVGVFFGPAGVINYFKFTFLVSFIFIIATLVGGDFFAAGIIALRDVIWVLFFVMIEKYSQWEQKHWGEM